MKRAVQFGRLEVFLDVYIFLGIGASAVLVFQLRIGAYLSFSEIVFENLL